MERWTRRCAALGLAAAALMALAGCPGDETPPVCEEPTDNNGADMGGDPIDMAPSADMTDPPRLGCDAPEPFGPGDIGDQKCVEGSTRLCAENRWIDTETPCTAEATVRIGELTLGRIASVSGDVQKRVVEMRARIVNSGDFPLTNLSCDYTLAQVPMMGDPEQVASGTMRRDDAMGPRKIWPNDAVWFTARWEPAMVPSATLELVANCRANDPDGVAVTVSEQLAL